MFTGFVAIFIFPTVKDGSIYTILRFVKWKFEFCDDSGLSPTKIVEIGFYGALLFLHIPGKDLPYLHGSLTVEY